MDGIIEAGANCYPTIEAFDTGGETARWWCRWCKTWHAHGQVRTGDHRLPHCHSRASPYFGGPGYVLELRPVTGEIRRAIRRGKRPPG
jgi:hypothetical protein